MANLQPSYSADPFRPQASQSGVDPDASRMVAANDTLYQRSGMPPPLASQSTIGGGHPGSRPGSRGGPPVNPLSQTPEVDGSQSASYSPRNGAGSGGIQRQGSYGSAGRASPPVGGGAFSPPNPDVYAADEDAEGVRGLATGGSAGSGGVPDGANPNAIGYEARSPNNDVGGQQWVASPPEKQMYSGSSEGRPQSGGSASGGRAPFIVASPPEKPGYDDDGYGDDDEVDGVPPPPPGGYGDEDDEATGTGTGSASMSPKARGGRGQRGGDGATFEKSKARQEAAGFMKRGAFGDQNNKAAAQFNSLMVGGAGPQGGMRRDPNDMDSVSHGDSAFGADGDQIFMPNLRREKFIPVRIARDKLKHVLSEMAQMKHMHYAALETMERQQEFLKAQLEAAIAGYARKLTTDYNDRVQALEEEYRTRLDSLNQAAMGDLRHTVEVVKSEARATERRMQATIDQKDREIEAERKIFLQKVEREKGTTGADKLRIQELEEEVRALRSSGGGGGAGGDASAELADLRDERDALAERAAEYEHEAEDLRIERDGHETRVEELENLLRENGIEPPPRDDRAVLSNDTAAIPPASESAVASPGGGVVGMGGGEYASGEGGYGDSAGQGYGSAEGYAGESGQAGYSDEQ